ncbi:MAG: bifunctional folylpolyglutamate synthase/dihydrofolate synthase [Candidatus Omnitrophica bacterium]|nr:bifunctional folylpolyglutamate synthase/dihydrofolate synthase [Candidatus Omnitrophota bacterium]
MNTYPQTIKYLESFVDYERKAFFPYRESLKLGRVQELLKRTNVAYEKLKTIHIAGTKGKGSTATFCSSILAASGFKVGLYTSPHLSDFRERIQIVTGRRSAMRGRLISKNDVARIVEKMRPSLEALRLSRKFGKLSFFEVYTAVALRYFLEKKVDFVVLETGLGGRLDATNVVTPLVSIITHIGYDHTDKLGKKLSHIAAEKAGIIKKRVRVVSSSQRASVLAVLRKTCKKKQAPFFLSGKDFFTRIRHRDNRRTIFDFQFNERLMRHLTITLLGAYQVENASCAMAAVELLRAQAVLSGRIRFAEGLKSASIEGRFEIIRKKPLVVVDIAHNPLAFTALAENLKVYFPGKEIILIFAAAQDKDVRNMLNKIRSKHLILTSFKNPRAFAPQEIKKRCDLPRAVIAQDISQAFKIAQDLYTQDSLIVVSGSLFLVSEAKQLLQATRCRQNSKAHRA